MTEPQTDRVESEATLAFREARDFLLAHREDYETAYRGFRWPALERFNWAHDWFDRLAMEQPEVTALWVVEEDGTEQRVTFAEMADRSRQVAGWLHEQGVGRGDRVLLVLGNRVELWECMLACIRLGTVMIPATTLLSPADVQDRVSRGNARCVITASADVEKFADVPADMIRVAVGDEVDGWASYSASYDWKGESPGNAVTRADEPLLLYFTSGTTSLPKLVEHTHA